MGLLIHRILPATQTWGERERKMQRKNKIKYCPISPSYRNLGLLCSAQNAEMCYFQVAWVLLSLFRENLGGKELIQAS